MGETGMMSFEDRGLVLCWLCGVLLARQVGAIAGMYFMGQAVNVVNCFDTPAPLMLSTLVV